MTSDASTSAATEADASSRGGSSNVGGVGVLVMAHGTPSARSEIEAFFTRIRRGHPPSPEQLADLVARYAAIGGTSPLAGRTASQLEGIGACLERVAPGELVLRYGAKHVAPFIEDAARDLVASGVREVVGIVLTPHRASMGSDEYLDRAEAALSGDVVPLVRVSQWYDAPGFAALLADRVKDALDRLPADAARRTVLFTAHSLPERVVAAGDPYPDQVAASADLVAAAAELRRAGVDWSVAWQSAGRTPEPWIGPDLLSVLRGLGGAGDEAHQEGRGVVVCPIGFVSDHLEVLYDVDIEAREVADAVGLAFERTTSLNGDPRFCEILASVVLEAAGRPRATGTAPGSG